MSPPLPAEAFRRWFEGSLPAQTMPRSEREASVVAGNTGYHRLGPIRPPATASSG